MGLLEDSLARAEACAGKGYELCKYGKYKDALKLYREATELDPTNYKYWYNAAVAYDRINDLTAMQIASQKTIECDGTFIKGYVRLAKAFVRQEKYDEAGEIITTGLLVEESNKELKDLKAIVLKKQEERSLIAARRLEDQLRKSDASNNSHKSSSPPIPPPPVSASGVTAVGANIRHPPQVSSGWKTSPGSSPLSKKQPLTTTPSSPSPIAGLNLGTAASRGRTDPNQGRQTASGGIPPYHREIPRLNNPQFGDSSTSSSTPRPPRLGQPVTRPIVPPNRADGPDYKDQCGTFIVAPTAVETMNESHAEQAQSNTTNNTNTKRTGRGFLGRRNHTDGRRNNTGGRKSNEDNRNLEF